MPGVGSGLCDKLLFSGRVDEVRARAQPQRRTAQLRSVLLGDDELGGLDELDGKPPLPPPPPPPQKLPPLPLGVWCKWAVLLLLALINTGSCVSSSFS
jgi:hypothetical protein